MQESHTHVHRVISAAALIINERESADEYLISVTEATSLCLSVCVCVSTCPHIDQGHRDHQAISLGSSARPTPTRGDGRRWRYITPLKEKIEGRQKHEDHPPPLPPSRPPPPTPRLVPVLPPLSSASQSLVSVLLGIKRLKWETADFSFHQSRPGGPCPEESGRVDRQMKRSNCRINRLKTTITIKLLLVKIFYLYFKKFFSLYSSPSRPIPLTGIRETYLKELLVSVRDGMSRYPRSVSVRCWSNQIEQRQL